MLCKLGKMMCNNKSDYNLARCIPNKSRKDPPKIIACRQEKQIEPIHYIDGRNSLLYYYAMIFL